MPKSEAHLDAPAGLLRVRLPGFTDSVGGVRFVDGEALDPMPQRVLTRLQGIGLRVEVVGPWEDLARDPPQPPALPVDGAREAAPSEGTDVTDAALEAIYDADDAARAEEPAAPDAPRRRRNR